MFRVESRNCANSTTAMTPRTTAAVFVVPEPIAKNSEYGIWMTKRGLWANLDAPSLRHAIELENRTQVLGTFTGNMREATIAFQEKRDPQWKPM